MIKYDPEISLENESPFSRLAKPIQHKKKSSRKKIVNCSSNVKLGFSSRFKKIKDLNQQHHFFKITKIQGFLNNRARLLLGKKAAQQKRIYCEKCLLHFQSKSKKEKHEDKGCYPCHLLSNLESHRAAFRELSCFSSSFMTSLLL